MASVLVIGAHPDDEVLGVGGILRKLHFQDDVHIVTCSDGAHSHSIVLNVFEHPTPQEVAAVREGELARACSIIGEGMCLTHEQWAYSDGKLQKTAGLLEVDILDLLGRFYPDVIYVHALDAHPDHRAVHDAALAALRRAGFAGEIYEYFIWTREFALGRQELLTQAQLDQIQEFTPDTIHVDVSEQNSTKRRALEAFESQVSSAPAYPGWLPQKKPILKPSFVEYHLRGEEIITPVRL